MFAATVEVRHGDVVASSTSTYYVQAVDPDGLTVLAINPNGLARHRSDVVPDHWSDIALSGLQLHDIVIRCVPLRRFTARNLIRLGRLSPMLRQKIEAALDRELSIRRFEESPPMRSNLEASTSSRGRKVSVARSA